ncbi:fungal-specific transcription factor domain-containing protein [Crepidotus variabilis]|uniref:Fungal-specific transcription factor domain-containing protein n=1 Tax=Crepidotus variabilis TaxID=179855 RepID=A0A9P6JN91_9AGAR|nr:fungal-specific transcription factor domain-containing protein [Crepidotus variabilis]
MQNRSSFASSFASPSTMTTGTPQFRQESDGDNDGGSQTKRARRVPGACDCCRRKKIRCDSTKTVDNICTNCRNSGAECTHKAVGKSLGSAKGYVESLEARLEKMDKLLSTLLPGIDFNQEIERLDQFEEPKPELLPRNDDDRAESEIATQFDKLKISPQTNRFFGKSSHIQLLQTALDVKSLTTGEISDLKEEVQTWKRNQYWDIPTWFGDEPTRDQWAGKPDYLYPSPELMKSLINLYFTNLNPYIPLLHRPTFEKLVDQSLHLTDRAFGATVILVCAHGSRYSDDTRVLADGTDSWLSAGWKFFAQVKLFRENLHEKTSLYELQAYALHASFASGSAQGIWVELGFAMRLAVEVGAHRKRSLAKPTIENELWKRAFWALFVTERRLSALSGRGCGLHDEDFDLDYPVECDDEYWDQGFKQPPGVPSTISYFNCYLRLVQILGQAMRFIYSVKRPRNLFYSGTARSDQELIAELDSMMNQWMDSVPDHLKWHQKHENDLIRRQSACIHAFYYFLQMFIHRPFVPSPRNPSPSSFPSLAICTNAARSCCHVLETFLSGPTVPLTFEITFNAVVVMLLNIWSGQKSGYAPHPKREMDSVAKCIEVLKRSEERWFAPGRSIDIVRVISSAGGTKPLIDGMRLGAMKKRPRDHPTDVVMPVDSTKLLGSTSPIGQPRSIAGSKRFTQDPNYYPSPATSDEVNSPAPDYPLPISTNELGRLPIYGQFNFLDSTSSALPTAPPSFPPSSSTVDPNNLAFFPDFDMMNGDFSAPYSLTNSTNAFSSDQLPASQAGGNSMADMLDYNSLFGFLSADSGPSKPPTTLDPQMLAMQSTAPINMTFEDWSSYLSMVNPMSPPPDKSSSTNYGN